MPNRQNQAHIQMSRHQRIFRACFIYLLKRLPFLSVAFEGWKLAFYAFSDENEKYLRKQQWKSFFTALINPRFASKWFAIIKSPEFFLLKKYRPKLYLKPFRAYISTKWDKKQRTKVILNTYRYIWERGEGFKRIITKGEWTEVARIGFSNGLEGHLKLGYDYRFRKEGELVFSLDFNQLGGRIVAAAFSFEELETGQWICRVGAVQGHPPENGDLSKTVQKLMYGLRPKSLIVFVIQEFSRQLGLSDIFVAGDSIQTYRGKHLIHLPKWHAIHFDYNRLWEESGGELVQNGWYKLPLTPKRKNIQDIKAKKRALYRRRYRLLDEISLMIANKINTLS
jgi:uncharacterized protein VirK/YbjX